MYQEQGRKIKIITKKAFDNGKLLNPRLMDMQTYENIRSTIGADIFEANYNQSPLDLGGELSRIDFWFHRKSPTKRGIIP